VVLVLALPLSFTEVLATLAGAFSTVFSVSFDAETGFSAFSTEALDVSFLGDAVFFFVRLGVLLGLGMI
jgi:hypothetical protein